MPDFLTDPSAGPVLAADMDEADLVAFAECMAPSLHPGDCIALSGDLGAGKTTLARALIRALVGDPVHDVPSPTFALRQDYEVPAQAGQSPTNIVHFDLYRLARAHELDEIGFAEALATSIVLVEWPERAGGDLPADRIEIELTSVLSDDQRRVSLSGHGRAQAKAEMIASEWRKRSAGPS